MGAGLAPGQERYPVVFHWHTVLHRRMLRGALPGTDCDLAERDAAFHSVTVGGSLE